MDLTGIIHNRDIPCDQKTSIKKTPAFAGVFALSNDLIIKLTLAFQFHQFLKYFFIFFIGFSEISLQL